MIFDHYIVEINRGMGLLVIETVGVRGHSRSKSFLNRWVTKYSNVTLNFLVATLPYP